MLEEFLVDELWSRLVELAVLLVLLELLETWAPQGLAYPTSLFC